MNVIQICGRLGKDAETRFTADGTKIVSFSLATSVYRGGKEETIWYNVTIFGDRFDKMLPYLTKGKAIMVVGEFHPRTYADKEGNNRVSYDVRAEMVKFSPFKEKQDENQTGGEGHHGMASGYQQQQSQMGEGAPFGHSPSFAVEDDNPPF